jgi:hypothetical protein
MSIMETAVPTGSTSSPAKTTPTKCGQTGRLHPGEVDDLTHVQSSDFRPGRNFVLEMDMVARLADRTIAIQSPNQWECKGWSESILAVSCPSRLPVSTAPNGPSWLRVFVGTVLIDLPFSSKVPQKPRDA